MKTAIVLFVLAVASFAAVFFIPDFQRTEIYNSAVNLEKFTLQDVVHPSLYKRTARSGDTIPHLSALFHAVNILRESSKPISDEKRVKAFLSSVEGEVQTTEQIYHFATASAFLRSLTPESSNNLYEKLVQLIDPASGFKPNSAGNATITASWQALEAISLLGKIDEFKGTPKFDSVLRFVRSLKNATGGYSDSKRKESSLDATYYAYKLLSKYDTIADKDVNGVLDFVSSCQSADGSYLEHSVHSNYERYYESGSLESTAHALQTILKISEVDLHSLLLPVQNYGVYNAISFLRFLVSTEFIKSRASDYYSSISATDELIALVNAYPALNFETPRSFQVGLLGAGLFFLSLGLYHVYRESLSKVKNFDFHHVVTGTAVLLLASAVILKTLPHLSVIPFIFLTGFLLKVFYNNLEDYLKTGEDTVLAVALGGSVIYAIFPLGSAYFSPLAFTQMSLYYILVFWGAVGVFVAFVIAKQFLGNTKAQNFYYSAATMSWIMNTILLYSIIYSRGLVTVVHHLVTVSGNFFSVYVALPVASLVLIFVTINVGLSMYPGTPMVPPKKK